MSTSVTKQRQDDNRNRLMAADNAAFAEALEIAKQILDEIHGMPMPSPYDPSCTSKLTPESFIKKIGLYISQSGVTPDAALRAADAFSSRFLIHYRGKSTAPVSKLLTWMIVSAAVPTAVKA